MADEDQKKRDDKIPEEQYEGRSFGICNECKTSIAYPSVRIPTEVIAIFDEDKERDSFSRTYNITYSDMHWSCAFKWLWHTVGAKVIVERTWKFWRPNVRFVYRDESSENKIVKDRKRFNETKPDESNVPHPGVDGRLEANRETVRPRGAVPRKRDQRNRELF